MRNGKLLKIWWPAKGTYQISSIKYFPWNHRSLAAYMSQGSVWYGQSSDEFFLILFEIKVKSIFEYNRSLLLSSSHNAFKCEGNKNLYLNSVLSKYTKNRFFYARIGDKNPLFTMMYVSRVGNTFFLMSSAQVEATHLKEDRVGNLIPRDEEYRRIFICDTPHRQKVVSIKI